MTVTFGLMRSWNASIVPEPSSSMNIVPVAPIGLPAKAVYSLTAVAASLKKISTGPLVTAANTNGDCSGTCMPRSKPRTST